MNNMITMMKNDDMMNVLWVIRDRGIPRVIGFNRESLEYKIHSNPRFAGQNIWRKALDDSGFTYITDIWKLEEFDSSKLPEIIPYKTLNRAEIELYLSKFSNPSYYKKDLEFYTNQEKLFAEAARILDILRYIPKIEWEAFLKENPNKIIESSFIYPKYRRKLNISLPNRNR